MRIVIDARLYGLENAGLGRYAINLIEYLKKLDYQNEYFVLLRRKYFEKLNFSPNWHKVLADFRHYTIAEQIKLPKILSTIDPDLVHFLHFNVPIFYNGKYVVTIHDKLMHEQKGINATTLNPLVYFIKRLGYRLVFDTAIRKSKAIIVPSHAVKEDLLQKYRLDESKIAVTYEGLDAGIMFEDQIRMDRPYFVYAGNAYPHKNLGRLVEAIILLNKKYNQKVFLAVASVRNIFTQRLQNLIKELEAEEYTRLLGFVPDEKLGFLYKNSVGFVFPSLSEGFGLTGLEALKAGTVLLSSQIEVFREIYSDYALYFDPLDVSSIEGAMEKALKLTESDRKKMIENGQKFVKRYSWSKMAKETLKIYEEEAKGGDSVRSG